MVSQQQASWNSRPRTAANGGVPPLPPPPESFTHMLKRTYSEVFHGAVQDFVPQEVLMNAPGPRAGPDNTRIHHILLDRRPATAVTPGQTPLRRAHTTAVRRPNEAPPLAHSKSIRALVRRATTVVRRRPPMRSNTMRDSAHSTELPERPSRRPSLFQKSGFKSFRRHAVSNTSGEEGRWNPSPPPLPSPTMMYTGAGDAARASAAAHNTRLQYGPPSRTGTLSSHASDGCDSMMTEPADGILMRRQDSVDSLASSTPVVRADPVQRLPTELMWEVFGLLDCATLVNAERVSKSWNRVAKDQAVWQKYYQRRYQAKVFVEPAPIQMGGPGMPSAYPGQDWKRAAIARRTIERRWASGRPAATYFNGHTDSVYCCQFDEDKIITGSRDRTIRIWDINTGRCTKVIGGPSYLPSASNSPPLAVETSHTISNVPSLNGSLEGRAIYHVPEDYHSASILCLQYDKDIMVTGSSDNTCIVWSMSTLQPIFRLRRHSAGVLDVCLDDKHIISCSKDQKICVWNRHTGQLIKELTGHTGPVNAVQLRGHLLVSASGDGIAKLWDLNTMTCIRDFSSKDRGLAAVEFSDDTKYVLAGGNDQVVYKFSTETGELVHTYQGHTGLVRSLFLDAFNDVVVSGSYDQSLRIYNYTTGKLYGTYENWTTSWILSAKSDYRRCVCTSQDGRALMLDFGYKVNGADILKTMPY